MQLAIVLFAVVVAVSAHPGLIDPWAAPQVVAAPEHHYVGVSHGHAPVAVHPQYVKVAQPAPIPALHPQPLNIKVPHTQSVRLPVGHVHISHPHLIGVEVSHPEPEPVIAKHAVVHKTVHAAPAHPW
ncbi:uncharacterized protein [Neodiprion pinetum]|uniref:Uncharacterized protein LOC107216778 n=1 Tax=Neodiprion lecontei TaxID=441921 RepID=A0A6J0B5X2_NEOLC|nr:uncharacterized protein LOC107216778 [Neodiprion lecontei]XP_046431235.1 uncharacterized protein LOC124184983 [Neodiprion fabricii]XP_046487503.1 uncharacterized protein LOC124221479 [Neodiprion pinetum]XP_046625005.1 uncharacterized protein LOC124307405 [Neodiprion virginianus]